MKKFLKENWKFLLFVLIGGSIGGYCTGLYLFDMLSEAALKQLQEMNITKEMYGLTAMLQYGVFYGVILAAIGVPISKKVGLWKEVRYDSKAAKAAAVVTVISALILFPGDKLIFGPLSSFVTDYYSKAPGLAETIAGLLVGGIIEEVIMRLFLMSLFTLIISKIFCRKEQNIHAGVYAAANVISALLFAAGHLPGTMAMTTLTPTLVIRCFLFNGGLGLCFGWLYRKYGIAYAMAAHGLAHLIADILMNIFI